MFVSYTFVGRREVEQVDSEVDINACQHGVDVVPVRLFRLFSHLLDLLQRVVV